MPRRLQNLTAAAGLWLALAASATAQNTGGLTRPVVLPPYVPDAPKCNPPPGRAHLLAFAQDNRRQFMQGASFGLSMAARDTGFAYQAVIADNDAAKMIAQVDALREAQAAAIVTAPIDAPSLAPSLQRAIEAGIYVGAIVPPPATTLLNAPQYLAGKVLGEAAAAYIRDSLGGKAKVVLLTHDSLQFLAPRFTAMRDALKDMPGVTIVADISPLTVNEEGGAATMKTVLLANPKVDVVLGADTVVLGALEALRAAGKARPDQFLGGIDGEPQAVAEIRKGGPYKATVALASPVFGYALGRFAAQWLGGGSVPQAMDILPRLLGAANLSAYEADLANPAAVYNDVARRDAYLKMYGNICYDTRDNYINFPWSSERR